jgi:hypothetical protein
LLGSSGDWRETGNSSLRLGLIASQKANGFRLLGVATVRLEIRRNDVDLLTHAAATVAAAANPTRGLEACDDDSPCLLVLGEPPSRSRLLGDGVVLVHGSSSFNRRGELTLGELFRRRGVVHVSSSRDLVLQATSPAGLSGMANCRNCFCLDLGVMALDLGLTIESVRHHFQTLYEDISCPRESREFRAVRTLCVDACCFEAYLYLPGAVRVTSRFGWPKDFA